MTFEFPVTLAATFRVTADTKAEAESVMRDALISLDDNPPTVGHTSAINIVLKPKLLTAAQAKKRILAKWPAWLAANKMDRPNGNHGMSFFLFIKREHPDLLHFNIYGDAWQTVHSFLIQDHLVSD